MSQKKTSKDALSSIGAFMRQSSQSADDRFAVAERITAAQPSGLSSVQPTQTIEPRVHHYTPAGTVMAPIAKVRDNPFNARKIYREEIVRERSASIAKDGQMQPAPACIDPSDPTSYILIGGHYRKRALQLLGRTEIELKLLNAPTDIDLYRLSYTENNDREAGTPLDNAMAWQDLLDKGTVANDDEIASAIALPRTTIAKHRQILKLPVPVLEVLKESPERFTLTAAYELQTLSELMSADELLRLAKQIAADDGLSTRELQAIKSRLVNPQGRKVKEISRQHKIVLNGEVLGHIKEWDTGRVELDIKIADQSEREKLVAELRNRFGIGGDSPQLSL